MPQQNLVSFGLPENDLAEIRTAISTLSTKLLPALKSLTAPERMEMAKMGDKTVAFVQKALEHCTANPELAPQFLDVTEFSGDVRAVETLRSIHAPLLQITDSLSDTMMLAGSDAYAAALIFYNSIRSAHKSNIAKAGAIYDDLAGRFPGRPKSKNQQAQASS